MGRPLFSSTSRTPACRGGLQFRGGLGAGGPECAQLRASLAGALSRPQPPSAAQPLSAGLPCAHSQPCPCAQPECAQRGLQWLYARGQLAQRGHAPFGRGGRPRAQAHDPRRLVLALAYVEKSRQVKLRAASSLGQPRPASASLSQPRPASASLGQPRPIGSYAPAGRPYRPCFSQVLVA